MHTVYTTLKSMKNLKIKKIVLHYLLLIAFIISILVSLPHIAISEIKESFLYRLSNFNGSVPYNWARIFVDKEKNEIYVVYENLVRIFNENGMEIYSFSDTVKLGNIYDVTVDNNGNIIILSYKGNNYLITLSNFMGQPTSEIELKNLPLEYSGFLPNRIVYRNGNLYLASLNSMKVVITDTQGFFRDGYDLAKIIGLEEDDRANTGIGGFNLDNEGNILFTIPVIARAYKLSPDRKVASFGKRGSAPGRFGIPGDIVADNFGNSIVCDTLRSVIIVFDKDFKFLTEFGYRGFGPGNLIAPMNLAIDDNSRIYVSQLRNRGISVFRIIYD